MTTTVRIENLGPARVTVEANTVDGTQTYSKADLPPGDELEQDVHATQVIRIVEGLPKEEEDQDQSGREAGRTNPPRQPEG